jgi:large subunit ribosomal protein L10
MPKTKEQKKEIIKNLEEKIERSKSVIFAGFNGLGVKDNEDLRKELKKENGEYLVTKKTLLNIAFKNKGYNDLKVEDFTGQVASIFSYEDEIAPAKTLDKFRKDKEDKIYFLGGLLEGKIIDKIKVEVLAKLPSKEELYAKMLGSIKSPVSGFVNALSGNLRNLVYVLKAVEDKKNN